MQQTSSEGNLNPQLQRSYLSRVNSMAEAAIVVHIATELASVLLKDVSKKTVDALSQSSAIVGLRSAFFGGLKSDLRLLEQEFLKLQALLPAAERVNHANAIVLAWLGRVEDVAHYADNLLDEMSYEKIRLQVENRGRSSVGFSAAMVGKVVSASKGSAFRSRVGRKIKKFMSMASLLYKEAQEIGLRPVELLADQQSFRDLSPMADVCDSLERTAYVDAKEMVGRQQDEELIINKLCCSEDDQALSVVAIVGMSGLGKTTLARKVYDNEKVVKHFQERIWIVVSDNFRLRKTLNEMVESVTSKGSNLSNIDGIEKKLHMHLKEKRYLLVLDDVWNIDVNLWKFMKSLLRRVSSLVGSTVLVTTKMGGVASVMEASLAHGLKELSGSDSWILFKREAFANKSLAQRSDLEEVGKSIVQKCKGVPLAIKALGSLLRSRDEKQEWESIESSQVWGSITGNNGVMVMEQVMPSLLLSYNNLPNESIKRCFSYCSVILPKGFCSTEMTIVELWMAQGYLQQSEVETMEDIGRIYLKILLDHFLLQVDKYDIYGAVITYRMHDLMHELALYITKGTSFIMRSLDELTNPSAVRHVRITDKNMHTLTDFPGGVTFDRLRSLFSFNRISVNGSVMRYLRVLNLTCGLTEVPASIGGLKHLRYLDLSKNPFEVLPDSIGDVGHLQTLKLKNCDSLIKLPEQLTKLINLRHINTTKHVVLPVGFGQLTDLQELPMLNLQAVGWEIGELGCLQNIGGELSIKGAEHIKGEEDARRSNLATMAKVLELELIWNRQRSVVDGDHDNELAVMDGLQPHSNLKGLLVKNYNGKRFSPWLSDKPVFPNLRVVSLLNCKGCEQLPTLGNLPSLEIVIIKGMTSLKDIGIGFFYSDDQKIDFGRSSSSGAIEERTLFPKLKELTFEDMPSLQSWSEPPRESIASIFPFLKLLAIKDCPQLRSAPTHFASLQKLRFRCVNSGEPLQMILSNSSQLTSLTSVIIENVNLLPSLSQELLQSTSLQEIKISRCKELTALPQTLQSLHSLGTFQVEDCDKVTSLPDITGLSSLTRLVVRNCRSLKLVPKGLETCTSIETLALSGCPKLNFIPDLAPLSRLEKVILRTFSKQALLPDWIGSIPHLHSLDIGEFDRDLDTFPDVSDLPRSLRSLYIVGWPKLQSLPSQLHIFAQLERLALFSFNGVEALPEWLCRLSSLQALWVWQCKTMNSLASKDAMRRLDKLRLLDIRGCPLLEAGCIKDTGAEWDKIAHIRWVFISGKDIQKPT